MQELAEANATVQHLLRQLQILVNIYDRADLEPAALNDWWSKYIALSIKLRRPLCIRATEFSFEDLVV